MPAIAPNAACPCQSGKKYKKCCRPYHAGMQPLTPEALMRSRYSAYFAGNTHYIMKTTHPDSEWHRDDAAKWERELVRLTKDNQYLGLKISETETAPDNQTGWVTFTATIMQNGEDISFTEKSRFEKRDGRWLYVSGDISMSEK